MARPTVAECEVIRTRYAEADEALHKLQMGAAEVSIRMGEKSVDYNSANLADLRAYVSLLKSRVAACNGACRSGLRTFTVTPTN